MGKLTLVTGGARSGKSRYALELAATANSMLFVATAQPFDEDMADRIKRHRDERPAHWQTLEAPLLDEAAQSLAEFTGEMVIIDCVTLLTSNVLLRAAEDVTMAELHAAMAPHVAAILNAHRQYAADTVVVTNEVGLGIVPAYRLGRLYRDLLGRVNQQLAAAADEVIMMVSGLPLTVK